MAKEDYIVSRLDESYLRDQSFFDGLGKANLYRQQKYLFTLLNKKMVNFSHMTNTDLRLHYGTATLTSIENYEDNYNNFIKTLYILSSELMEVGETELAVAI